MLVGELRIARTERDLLKERLNKFLRKLFEARSESLAHQKELFFNEAEAEGAAAQPAAEEACDEPTIEVPAHQRKARRGRKRLDPALPREGVRHELPEAERVWPHDGSALAEIGVETSEQLDIIAQQVRVIRHERVKYACPCCDGAIKLAARPAQIIPRGLFTEATNAWVVTAKYDDGMPLYRSADGALRRQRLEPQHAGCHGRQARTGHAAADQPDEGPAAGELRGPTSTSRPSSQRCPRRRLPTITRRCCPGACSWRADRIDRCGSSPRPLPCQQSTRGAGGAVQ